MANIANFLKSIKTAIYGREVRGAIHDGIDAINKDCTERLNGQDDKLTEQDTIIENNVARQDSLERKYDEQIKNIASSEPQNAEIVDARNGFTTLGKVLKQKIYHFSNVEEMRKCVNLVEGDVVETLGYYEENDGGGGKYNIRLKNTDDEDDGGSLHVISNGLVAELIIKNELLIDNFGTKGDGITDDTLAIQKAFEYARSKNIKVFANTYKTYLISESVVINELNVDFNKATVITRSAIDIFETNSTKFYGNLKNVKIDCNHISTTDIHIIEGRKKYFENIDIINCSNTAIKYDKGYE